MVTSSVKSVTRDDLVSTVDTLDLPTSITSKLLDNYRLSFRCLLLPFQKFLWFAKIDRASGDSKPSPDLKICDFRDIEDLHLWCSVLYPTHSSH